MYVVDVAASDDTTLRFALASFGLPFHAAPTAFGPRSLPSDPHVHADFYELMGVVDGRGLHRLDTGVQELAAGDVVLVRDRDRHAFQGLGPTGLEFVNVAFPTSAWRSFLALADLDPAGTWDQAPVPPKLRAGGEGLTEVRRVFTDAVRASHTTCTALDLLRFWCDLLGPLRVPSAGEHGPPRPEWLASACAAMRREENLRGGVPRLRELAAVSAAHLSRSMRAAYGLTPTQFVTDLRLEHAAALLAATTEPVTRVALSCGFTSQSYFTRRFSQAHGLSPREFRRRAQRTFVP